MKGNIFLNLSYDMLSQWMTGLNFFLSYRNEKSYNAESLSKPHIKFDVLRIAIVIAMLPNSKCESSEFH